MQIQHRKILSMSEHTDKKTMQQLANVDGALEFYVQGTYKKKAE